MIVGMRNEKLAARPTDEHYNDPFEIKEFTPTKYLFDVDVYPP